MRNLLYIDGKKYYFNAVSCLIELCPTPSMKESK